MRIPLMRSLSVAAAVALLAGCGLLGGDDSPEQDEPGSEEQGAEVESGTAPDAENSLGETSFTHESGEVELVINGLTERGELLQLDYTLTLVPGDPSQSDSQSLRTLFDAGSGRNMYLVDTANLRRHIVVRDDGNTALEPDPWDTELEPDQPATLTALFASAEDMEAVDVYLYKFPPIMDVPVAKEGA
jgi:predicted small lipoprotein YifL